MSAAEYRPPLADYFDELERRYGDQFSFDKLNDEELATVERLTREAIEHDPRVSAVEKKNLAPLLTLLDMQRGKRKAARH
ncbi:hypothetical protein [Acidihalobacter ferrooxydans]|uniref:Uncharacterized protein n=1 Tax=Acidihalobacter ferrooxydans TaxID=1765967 RepID=A0A1P8UJJ1_9GAMM|nr:hypothetical protein [Acidihalobacter ferrooxydans]APZ43980.1 hypothetical protein BW247_13495 [Acidihalobacter ferrooxydans]